MLTICSYCHATMVPGPPKPVSHGICKACYEKWMQELDQLDAARKEA